MVSSGRVLQDLTGKADSVNVIAKAKKATFRSIEDSGKTTVVAMHQADVESFRAEYHVIRNEEENGSYDDRVPLNELVKEKYFGDFGLVGFLEEQTRDGHGGSTMTPSEHEELREMLRLLASDNVPGPQMTMKYEMLRLCTMKTFPGRDRPFAVRIVGAGFYYAGHQDQVICYCCGNRKDSWVIGDIPLLIHQNMAPDCGFLTHNTLVNVPIKKANSSESPSHAEVQLLAVQRFYGSNQSDTAQGESSLMLPSSEKNQWHNLSDNLPTIYAHAYSMEEPPPKYPQYAVKNMRINSFQGWPAELQQRPEEMAECGFYYAGFNDCVRCFFCGVGLRHWMSEDDPWIEHARWSLSCVYVLKMKGEEFISLIKMAVEIAEREEAARNNSGGNQASQESKEAAPTIVIQEAPESSVATNSTAIKDLPGSVGATDGNVVRGAASTLPPGNTEIQKYLLTDAAQSVLEMGYQPKLVQRAIERVLIKKATEELTVEIITEAVFEIHEEDKLQSKKPVSLQSAEGDKSSEKGFNDCVCCFHCGVGLRHWMSEDDPWIEHARWSTSCVYVLKMKGEEFVSLIKMAVEIAEREEAARCNSGGNQAPEDSCETTPAVTANNGNKEEWTSYNKSFWPSDGKSQVDSEIWYLNWSQDHPYFRNRITVLAILFGTEPLPPRLYIVQNDYGYHYESVRLATFSQYQGSGFGTRLAQSGFVYDDSRSMVVCPWDGSDVSSEITRNRHIMNCAFVRQFYQINIPLHEAPSPPLPAAFVFDMAATMTFSPATEEQPDRIQSQTETDSTEMASREEPSQNAGSGLRQSSEVINAADISHIGLTDQEEGYFNNSSSLLSFNAALDGMISRENDIDERINNGTQQSQGINGATANASVLTLRNPGQWSSSDRIRSPQYQAYSVRLASFAGWPNDIMQRPEHVADAGFYYTGLQDVVRCFACDGELKNWDPEDDPWIEHARWFSQCSFVQRVKGQEFIDLVRRMTEESDEDEDAVVHSTFQPNNPIADAPNLRNELNPQLDQENEKSVLETEAAKKCLTELGFSRDVVARAINELLNKGDQRESSSLPSPGPSAQITNVEERKVVEILELIWRKH